MRDLLNELGVRKCHVAAATVGFFVWLSAIVSSAAGWNPFGVHWDFTNPGSFGDAFGPLNSLMAMIAAVGAIGAYRLQARELHESRLRQSEQDAAATNDRIRLLEREAELDRQATKSAFEGTFFKLIETFQNIVSTVDVSQKGRTPATAHDAFKNILSQLEDMDSALNGESEEAWRLISIKFRNDLNHYFRFIYNILRFIEDSQQIDKFNYVRFLRALLSESELVVIALNCGYGEGISKFKPLVEKYAFLQNISSESIARWNIKGMFASSAFEYSEVKQDIAAT